MTVRAQVLVEGPFFQVTDAAGDQCLHLGTCPKYVEQVTAGGKLEVVEFDSGDGWICSCIEIEQSIVADRTDGPSIDPKGRPAANGGTKAEPVEAATEAEAIEAIRALPKGEKFDVHHITPALQGFAVQWAKAYTGDFEYMIDMKIAAAKPRSLSQAQAKGVMNCFRADYWRNQQSKPKVETTVREETSAEGVVVPDGKYTVVFADGERRTLKLSTKKPDASFAPNEQVVSVLTGPDNTDYRSYTQFGFTTNGQLRVWSKFKSESTLVEAVRVLMEDPRAAASAFGMESGHCGVCGRELTVPESIEMGIGPVCLQKF